MKPGALILSFLAALLATPLLYFLYLVGKGMWVVTIRHVAIVRATRLAKKLKAKVNTIAWLSGLITAREFEKVIRDLDDMNAMIEKAEEMNQRMREMGILDD